MDLAAFRAAFPILATRAYLFSGGIAPAARPVLASMDSWIDRWTHDPLAHRADYFADQEAVRDALAQLLHCARDSIALTDTTSRASNLAVQLVPLQPGANVVVDSTTHPSMHMPWRTPGLRHVEVRRSPDPPGPDSVASVIDGRTAAVIVSHVDGMTGFRHDLAALAEVAHACGALLLVDAAQSVGVVDVDVAAVGVDLLSGLSMKWLLGPPGIGFLYARSDLVEAATLGHVGYLTAKLDERDELLFVPGARRHELGIGNLAGYAGFRAGLELIRAVGVPAIESRIAELTARLTAELADRGLDILTPREPGRRAGVVALRIGRAEALAAFLRERRVDVWGYDDTRRLRVDPHAFNDEDDLDRFLAGLDAFAGTVGLALSLHA